MLPLGFGITWLGYSIGLWGYLLIRGVDVTLGELVNPLHVMSWPQPLINDPTVILPSGTHAKGTTPAAGKTAAQQGSPVSGILAGAPKSKQPLSTGQRVGIDALNWLKIFLGTGIT